MDAGHGGMDPAAMEDTAIMKVTAGMAVMVITAAIGAEVTVVVKTMKNKMNILVVAI